MSMAEDAGIDVWRCEFCDRKVGASGDYIVGLDGMRAHRRCVSAFRRRQEAADRSEYRDAMRATKAAS